MNSKNNGKIVIGILVMFVVALSIVGVTYAYFVAQFSTNNNTESVRVEAGELIANYTHGQSIDVSNVVPGWISDGLHYYDVDEATAHGGQIYSSKATVALTQQAGTKATANMGIAAPVEFTVTNASTATTDDTVNYIIELNVTLNGVYNAWKTASDKIAAAVEAGGEGSAADIANRDGYAADRNRIFVSLYRGNFEVANAEDKFAGKENYCTAAQKEAADFDGTCATTAELIGGPYILGDSGATQMLVTAPEVLEDAGDSKDYFVVFKYENANEIQISQKISIQATVSIRGIQESSDTKATPATDDAIWYDDDNVQITFATAPSAEQVTSRLTDPSPEKDVIAG